MVSQRRGEEHKTTGWQRKRYTPGGPALDNDDAAINLLSENTALCAVFFFLTQYAFDDELDVLLTEGMPVQGLGLIWPDWATQLLGE